MAKLVVGVDVGGTNTDAVILKGREVIANVKHPTMADRTDGVRKAIENVIENLVRVNPKPNLNTEVEKMLSTA